MAKETEGTKETKGKQVTQKPADTLSSPKSLSSLKSFSPIPGHGFNTTHGGYERLLSYQKAIIVYDATLYFCDRFIDKKSRTHDQMVPAARSDKQNIAEASDASGTSKETEIKLTGVAKTIELRRVRIRLYHNPKENSRSWAGWPALRPQRHARATTEYCALQSI